ncbi:MAG: sigma 54 modulation/S30EA ribosomal C-terminal domain-containing protein [Bacilli bacterium]|nr:MAG: sigma 54 modulation/S30EA ribosomal C-terminal domain-containing protein [Bacilli bacterium]
MKKRLFLEMELLGHSFFVYKDMDTNKTCVLYKKKKMETMV